MWPAGEPIGLCQGYQLWMESDAFAPVRVCVLLHVCVLHVCVACVCYMCVCCMCVCCMCVLEVYVLHVCSMCVLLRNVAFFIILMCVTQLARRMWALIVAEYRAEYGCMPTAETVGLKVGIYMFKKKVSAFGFL